MIYPFFAKFSLQIYTFSSYIAKNAMIFFVKISSFLQQSLIFRIFIHKKLYLCFEMHD